MTSIGKPLVCGRSADIHAWRDGYLLKLYHAGFGRVHAQREANRTGIALAAGIVVPEVLELVTLADRHGLVLRKVPGPTLLQALVRSPGDASSLARRFAELHASIHACRASGLPEQRVLLERLIPKASDVEDALKRLALLSLQAASTEAVLCHGDFHPMNIILAPDGPVILDWYKASRGDPALDVARTLMVINMVPVSRRQANDPRALQAARETFSRAYQLRYAELRPECMRRANAMLLPVAVARLATDISAAERGALIKLLNELNGQPGGTPAS